MLIRVYGLRRHIWMGVSELEAGFLSGEARLREIPESLRHTPQHGRSQLHVSPLPDRKAFGGNWNSTGPSFFSASSGCSERTKSEVKSATLRKRATCVIFWCALMAN